VKGASGRPTNASKRLKASLSLAASCLGGLVLRHRPDYLMGGFHREACAALDGFLGAAARRESPRLLITAPPRHGKSELASRYFPAYVLGKYPDFRIVSASYAFHLACQMSRAVQRIMDSPEYLQLYPGTRLRTPGAGLPGQDAAMRTQGQFEVVGRKGFYRAVGVQGSITGFGADCIIIDDPVKSHEEADSPVYRDRVWDWYTSTLYTRLEPGGGIVLIQTRWHEDDLAGRLLEAVRAGTGDRWEHLNFPAVAETDEGWRKAGEALHPERYPLEDLARIREAAGPRDWAALYQQRPAPDEGAVFRKDWLRRWTSATLPPSFDRVIMSWDMTFKEGAGTDFAVGQVWGRKGADCYLLDQTRSRMGFVETCAAFRALAARWPEAREKLVEDKANGPAVMDALRRQVPGIIPVSPDGSKTARAHAVTWLFEAGNVWLPAASERPWAGEFETEILTFPAAAHDDQVDAMTQALRRLARQPGLRVSAEAVTASKKPVPRRAA
jgi:predicted phage terminase large subunit-like protein